MTYEARYILYLKSFAIMAEMIITNLFTTLCPILFHLFLNRIKRNASKQLKHFPQRSLPLKEHK